MAISRIVIFFVILLWSLKSFECSCTCSSDGITCSGSIESIDFDLSCRKLATAIVFKIDVTSAGCRLNLTDSIPNLKRIEFENEEKTLCQCILDKRPECDSIRAPIISSQKLIPATDSSIILSENIIQCQRDLHGKSTSLNECLQEVHSKGLENEKTKEGMIQCQRDSASKSSDFHTCQLEIERKSTNLIQCHQELMEYSMNLSVCNQEVYSRRIDNHSSLVELTKCRQSSELTVMKLKEEIDTSQAQMRDIESRLERSMSDVTECNRRSAEQRGTVIQWTTTLVDKDREINRLRVKLSAKEIEMSRQLTIIDQLQQELGRMQNSSEIGSAGFGSRGVETYSTSRSPYGLVVENVTLSVNGAAIECSYCCCEDTGKSGGVISALSKMIIVLTMCMYAFEY